MWRRPAVVPLCNATHSKIALDLINSFWDGKERCWIHCMSICMQTASPAGPSGRASYEPMQHFALGLQESSRKPAGPCSSVSSIKQRIAKAQGWNHSAPTAGANLSVFACVLQMSPWMSLLLNVNACTSTLKAELWFRWWFQMKSDEEFFMCTSLSKQTGTQLWGLSK